MRLNILSFLYTTLCWAAAVSLRLYRELKPWITLALLYARSLLLFLCRDYLLFSSVPPSPASSPQVYACSLIGTVHFLRPTSATVFKCFFPWFQACLSREQVCVQFVAFGVAQHRLLSSCCVSVGVLLGALAGALIGVATASGVVRGSISGAISGALSSVEVVEDSLAIWRNNGSGQWSILYLVSDMIQSSFSKHSFDRCFGFFETEILYSLMSGRLVNEKVDTPSRFCKADLFSLCLLLAKGFGHGEQLCALSAPFLEVLDDIFEAGGGGTKGMPKASVDKLPKINIHVEDCVDARSESISCAVCLQVRLVLPGLSHI